MKRFASWIMAAVMLVIVSASAVYAADIVNVDSTSAMDIMLDKSTVIWPDSGQFVEFTYITAPKTEEGRKQFDEYFNVEDTAKAAYKIRADRKQYIFNVIQTNIFNSAGTVTHQNTSTTPAQDISQTDGVKLCYEMIISQKIGLSSSEAAEIASVCYDDKNYAEAMSFMQFAAEQGHTKAQSVLGMMYLGSMAGTPTDYTLARHWLKKAADNGDAEGAGALAKMYYEGTGVDTDYKTAITYAKQAADKDNILGLKLMGVAYLNGNGVPQSTQKALGYMQRAAQLGDKQAKEFAAQIERRSRQEAAQAQQAFGTFLGILGQVAR